jgi:signal transduction protein with GAF and PtsI domain
MRMSWRASGSEGPNRSYEVYRDKTRERFAVLLDTGAMSHSVDGQTMLRMSTAKIRRVMDAEVIAVLLRNNETLRFHVIHGPTGEIRQTATIPLGQGITGWVAQEGKPMLLNGNVYEFPRFHKMYDCLIGCSLRSMLTVPLKAKGSTVSGIVQVVNKMQGGFSEDDIELLLVWASMAGMALEQ